MTLRIAYFDGVPILPCEGILSLLLDTFLAFRQAFIPVVNIALVLRTQAILLIDMFSIAGVSIHTCRQP